MKFEFRPLVKWPGTPCNSRRPSNFATSFARTLDQLKSELEKLNADNVVIQALIKDADLRKDGMLKEGCRPKGPGIIVSFDSKNGPLSYPCDTFLSWADNLRAITLALEALRAVDRYGVTRRGEQYAGWKRLGGDTAQPASMPKEEAAEKLSKLTDGMWKPAELLSNPENVRLARKLALRDWHPDKNKGDDSNFKLAGECARVLEMA